ncbi:MAG: cyclic lactone autoinducer peptide [Desulfitobacteriaceae bacterium]
MKKAIFAVISSVLLLLASATSVFACTWLFYQPKTPKALQK